MNAAGWRVAGLALALVAAAAACNRNRESSAPRTSAASRPAASAPAAHDRRQEADPAAPDPLLRQPEPGYEPYPQSMLKPSTAVTPLILASAHATVAMDRVGELRAGAGFDPERAIQSDGPPWTDVDMGTFAGEGCARYSGGSLPPGLWMMVRRGRIERFEWGRDGQADAGNAAPFALAPGMTRDQVLGKLPGEGWTRQPHPLLGARGEYLTLRDPGSGLALRVEMMDGRAVTVIWGRDEAVRSAEGCA